MKVQIATALIASYAVADTATTPSKTACEAFYAGLIAEGWDCAFEAGKSTECTKENMTWGNDAADDQEAVCNNVNGDDWFMAKPTEATCKKYTDAEIAKKADWTATDAIKKTAPWILACYKTGAATLAYGAAAIAAVAALSF